MRKLARKGAARFSILDEEISADICVADGGKLWPLTH
jgi:hypothetical protein